MQLRGDIAFTEEKITEEGADDFVNNTIPMFPDLEKRSSQSTAFSKDLYNEE